MADNMSLCIIKYTNIINSKNKEDTSNETIIL